MTTETLTATGPRGTYTAEVAGSEPWTDGGKTRWTLRMFARDAYGDTFGYFARDLDHAHEMLRKYAT